MSVREFDPPSDLPNSSGSRFPRAERVWQVFVGLVLVVAGSAICYVFFVTHPWRIEDFWQIGVLVTVEAYSLVGGLFILLGLRCIFGARNWIQRRIGGSLRHLLMAAVLLSIITLAAYFFILLTHANVA